MNHHPYCFNYNRIPLWIILLTNMISTQFLLVACSSSPSLSSTSTSSASSSFPCNQPDKWVSASPLAVSAICRDGFAMVTTHTSPTQEPLLMPLQINNNYDDDDDDDNSRKTLPDDTLKYPSLPSNYRGPLRIQRIDGSGTSFMAAGWRTDCMTLAERCRSLSAAEVARYGTNTNIMRRTTLDQGRILAENAALWMAQCAFSGSVRALSCVGLLACCHYDASNSNSNSTIGGAGGSLWLIDATGAYAVRAMAIGNGASCINKRLCHIPFHTVTKEEGIQLILNAIQEETNSFHESVHSEEEPNEDRWSLPEGSYLETAVVGFETLSLQRLRDPFELSRS